MRKTYLFPIYHLITGFPILLPVMVGAVGVLALIAVFLNPRPLTMTVPMAGYGLILLLVGLHDLREGVSFFLTLRRHPSEPWRALFTGKEDEFYAMRQSRDLIDVFWILCVFAITATVAIWAVVSLVPREGNLLDEVFLSVLAVTAVAVMFQILVEYYDSRCGRARLILRRGPIFAGRTFAGRISVPGYSLGDRHFTVTLHCRNELAWSKSWNETREVEGTADTAGISGLDFSFETPADRNGIFTLGIIWYLTAHSVNGGSNFHCRFSNLPVFPDPERKQQGD